jgi:hypothetical protein
MQEKSSDDRYVSDLSFTYLHWKIIDDLAKGEVTVDDLDDEMLELLCFNILP